MALIQGCFRQPSTSPSFMFIGVALKLKLLPAQVLRFLGSRLCAA